MAAKGKVGLFIDEDSLLPENYDLVYETSEVDIRVKYNINGQTVETETTKRNVEETLGISIWNQLTQTLTELLSRQLRKVISEFSLWELFGDNEPRLRERERALTLRSDLIADNFLCAAKDFVVQRSGRQIIIPHFEMVFKGKPCSVHLGTIRTCQGYVEDFSTLTRRKSWSCYDDDREIVIFGYLTLGEYAHGYKFYQARYETTDVSGTIGMTVYENRVFFRIVHLKNDEHCEYYIDRLCIENIRDIDVDVSGLASLGWLSPRIRAWTIGYFRRNAMKIQEDYMREAFNYAIQNCKCEHKFVEIIQNETHNKIT